jgi:hypothetical protein
MDWRTQRYNIYKFILQVWASRLSQAELELESAKDLAEFYEAQAKVDSLKKNRPKFPTI